MRSVSGQSGVTNDSECLQSHACPEEFIFIDLKTRSEPGASKIARFTTCMGSGSLSCELTLPLLHGHTDQSPHGRWRMRKIAYVQKTLSSSTHLNKDYLFVLILLHLKLNTKCLFQNFESTNMTITDTFVANNGNSHS